MKQLQAKINGKWHEVCCVELHNEAKSLVGSFAVDDIRLTDTTEQPESGCRCDGETVCRFCDKLDTPEEQKYEERRKLYQENGKKIIEIAHRYGIHELDLLKAMDEVKSLPIQEQTTQEIEPPTIPGNWEVPELKGEIELAEWAIKITAAVNALQKGAK